LPYVSIGYMSARHLARFVVAAMTVSAAGLNASTGIPAASAAPCSDVEVVFARATTEAPGVGSVGQAFVDSLRSQVGGKSVAVYGVNYPAADDFGPSASAGASDANAHVQSVVANCPDTKMVLGGYSQGALVIDLITAIPFPLAAGFTPAPMPTAVADHVAAVAVFGNPADRYVGMPLTAVSPLYGAKTIDLCAPGDPICSGSSGSLPTRDEMFSEAHLSYVKTGLATQGATFAAGRL
jgi:cutinase